MITWIFLLKFICWTLFRKSSWLRVLKKIRNLFIGEGHILKTSLILKRIPVSGIRCVRLSILQISILTSGVLYLKYISGIRTEAISLWMISRYELDQAIRLFMGWLKKSQTVSTKSASYREICLVT